MNELLLEYIICPSCLPEELSLNYEITEKQGSDITTGSLLCHSCGSLFPIIDGIAFLDPAGTDEVGSLDKYEQEEVVSSHLWTHYGDLLGEDNCNDAYPLWSKEIHPTSGIGLDLGGSVGRFTFELGEKCDLAVGIDSSVALIRMARELMQSGYITIPLKEEGKIRRMATIHLPRKWLDCEMAFIVGDVQKIPIRKNTASIVSSLNIIDKISAPRQHLLEMNRVSKEKDAQLLVSAPFSWSKAVTKPKEWLGGKQRGPYAGFGLNNIRTLLCTGMNHFSPIWKEEKRSQLWWRIRTHRNHFELIRSRYLKVER
ncbi:MAG: methyltransferase domain-containing protein [Desulfocapsa sp.]|nr:methyltransferase domain-containing protein [Desulfocapsa sp.]